MNITIRWRLLCLHKDILVITLPSIAVIQLHELPLWIRACLSDYKIMAQIFVKHCVGGLSHSGTAVQRKIKLWKKSKQSFFYYMNLFLFERHTNITSLVLYKTGWNFYDNHPKITTQETVTDSVRTKVKGTFVLNKCYFI